MVYRVAYSYLKNRQDAEDALQETFLRLIRGRVCFTDETHEKAWLVRTILALPDKYKAAVYLHYYEGCAVREIAAMLRQPPNTIKTWLSRARKLLKQELGGDPDA